MKQTCNIDIVDTSVAEERNGKHPSFLQNAISYGAEYSDYSGLHGVRYLGERNRNLTEKLWWMLVLIGSVYVCITLIFESYDKLTNSPIIISFSETPTPLFEIPFPAVTICPIQQCRQSVYNITAKEIEIMNNLNEGKVIPDEELKEFFDATLVCKLRTTGWWIPELNITTDSDTIKFSEKVAPQLLRTIINSDLKFQRVTTDLGICFTFNVLNKREIYRNEAYTGDSVMKSNARNGWTLDDGYLNDSLVTFPIRATKIKLDLTIRLSAYSEDEFENNPSGFQIIVHNPGEIPFFTSTKVKLPFGKKTLINVKPDLMVASQELRKYTPERRKCYFSFERTLLYYKNYTQINCDTECLANYILKNCNCIPINLPRNNSTPLCNYYKRRRCVNVAKERYLSAVATDVKSRACDCMPTCSHTKYNIDFTAQEILTDFELETFKNIEITNGYNHYYNEDDEGDDNDEDDTTVLYTGEDDVDDDNDNDDEDVSTPNILPGEDDVDEDNDKDADVLMPNKYAEVIIQFTQREYVAIQRKENYSMVDFLADCGGNLGLFVGFSLLSIFETIYFFSLRICCNIHRNGRHYWSGSNLISDHKEYNSEGINRKYAIQQEGISNTTGDIPLNEGVYINMNEL